MKKILLTLIFVLFSTLTFAAFPNGGNDAFIVVKDGDNSKENDFNYKFLNNPADSNKKNVIIGMDVNSRTDFTSLDAYALSGHKHTHDVITDILTYKIPSAALADDCIKCSLAEKATNSENATHTINAVEAAFCTEATLAKVSDKSVNDLPLVDIILNDTMVYTKDKGWTHYPHQFPVKAPRNTFWLVDGKKTPYMEDTGKIVNTMNEMANSLNKMNWVNLGLGVGLLAVIVFSFFCFVWRTTGLRAWTHHKIKIDGVNYDLYVSDLKPVSQGGIIGSLTKEV